MANLHGMTLSELQELKAQCDAKRYELINKSRDGLSKEELDVLTRETKTAREEAATVQFAIHSAHPTKYLPGFSGRRGWWMPHSDAWGSGVSVLACLW